MRPFSWHDLKRISPVAVLLAVEIILAATNYRPGTYLLGWDNVMPEFNFPQALITNIFGAWQEHRGVGLPDGMGHAANLVHTLFLWLLSPTLPQHALRYTFHFLMHFLGMAGMWMLLKKVIPAHAGIQRIKNWIPDQVGDDMLPFAGALFYGLNLITVQMFYTPLEAFSVHFAALPWIAYSLTLYLQQPSRNTLLLFTTVSLLATPQYFIPTLILPTILLLVGIGIFGNVPGNGIRHWKRLLMAAGTYLAVNSFWLLPYIANLPINSTIIQNAKINQMSSGEVYARNRAFGDLGNVLTFRGFMLDFEDVNDEGMPIHVMYAWRTWTASPAGNAIAWSLAVLMLIGAGSALFHKPSRTLAFPFLVMWVSSMAMLGNNTPGLSDVMGILRDRVPLFAEAYRFPFTKFSLLFGFSGTILLVWGLHYAVLIIRKATRLSIEIGAVVFLLASVLFSAVPSFQGHMFYDALRVHLPIDYLSLFAFMDKQDHFGRTAYLPQPSFWSWKHYRFGAVGSGFVWYGLPQPLMDRAFDPWSNVNENYYWELSRAIYSKDTEALQAVFTKYDIRYVILDGFLSAPSHDRSLFLEETEALLAVLPDIKPIGTTGTITVYERTAATVSHIRVANGLPTVTPSYTWTDSDVAFRTVGDYRVSQIYDPATTILFPFRSLFTKRAIGEREFVSEQTKDSIVIASKVAGIRATLDTTAPAFSTQQSGMLVPSAVNPCGVLKLGSVQTESVRDPRGNPALRISSMDQRACAVLGDAALPHAQGYVITVSSRHVSGRPLQLSVINNTAKHIELETFLPGTDDWTESTFILPPLAADGLGYTVYLTNDAIGSEPTTNEIGDINFYPLPFDALMTSSNGKPASRSQNRPMEQSKITHVNPGWYTVTIPQGSESLILSQAYNPLWAAYDVTGRPAMEKALPFVFGNKIPTHIMVNNWENGWQISGNEREIVIIFLPQLLEYVGLAILLTIYILYIFPSRKQTAERI